MSLINNQTNRVYLENEVYNKTRELKKLENNYMVDLASYSQANPRSITLSALI